MNSVGINEPVGATGLASALFHEPGDFMSYLHVLTYSQGFGRDTVSMSQGQLERFNGAVRNTVRKSIERLIAQGWIEYIEEFEASRTSRKFSKKT